MAFATLTCFNVYGLCQGVLFILYGFCHSDSSLYMDFATITYSLYMVFATVTIDFIWLLRHLLFNLYGLCQGLLFILHGVCSSYSSFYMAFATITLHCIWLLQQLLFNLYGFCQALLLILYGLLELILLLYCFCHSYSSFYMAFVRRLLIMKLPHPRLVQQPFPCMRAEIGQQTAKAERFGQELRHTMWTNLHMTSMSLSRVVCLVPRHAIIEARMR